MRSKLYLFLFMATLTQAKVVTVGPGKQYATVGAAVNSALPLYENLYVLVAIPTGAWTTADVVGPNASWNGFEVIVSGFKAIPTTTAYVEDEVIYEHNGVELQETYVNFKGLDGIEGRLEGSQTTYYAKDHLGSTRVAVSADARLRKEVNFYQSYGKLKQYTASPVQTKQKFTGKELDSEQGLYYFGARYYDSELGMWISPDPTRQYYSPYTYCGNNPISCVDKDGRVGENASLQYMMSTVLGIEPGKFSSGNSGPASENMEVANRRVGTAIDFAGIWFLPARALGLAFTGLEVGGALQSGDHAQAGSMVLEEGIKAKGGQELGGGVKGFLFGEAAKFLFRKFGSEGAGALPDPGQPSIDLRLSAPADASHVKGR